MNTEEKLDLNKKIRNYKGENPFIQSLKKQLKTNTYLEKIKVGKRNMKILSDNQYSIAKDILN